MARIMGYALDRTNLQEESGVPRWKLPLRAFDCSASQSCGKSDPAPIDTSPRDNIVRKPIRVSEGKRRSRHIGFSCGDLASFLEQEAENCSVLLRCLWCF